MHWRRRITAASTVVSSTWRNPWIEEHGVEYQIVIGDERLARKFGAMGFPTLAIITPDGQIDSLHVGVLELEELESLVALFTK